MKALKWIMICTVLVSGMLSAAAQEGERGTRTREARPERPESTMTPEERAKQAERASRIAAMVVARKMEVSEETAETFIRNYATAAKESRAQMEKFRGQDRANMDHEAMMKSFQENRTKMAEALKKGLTEEQAKIAATYLGGYISLERSIEGLLRGKVDREKTRKAMPVILKYLENSQKLMPTRGQAGAGAAPAAANREVTMKKFTELREKYNKDLTEIIGEEAAKAMGGQRGSMMMRGSGRPGGAGAEDRGEGRTRPEGAEGRSIRQGGGRAAGGTGAGAAK